MLSCSAHALLTAVGGTPTPPTFGDQHVSVRARHRAVNLADQLHVVEQGVEGVEVREAHHVGGAASGGLRGGLLKCRK